MGWMCLTGYECANSNIMEPIQFHFMRYYSITIHVTLNQKCWGSYAIKKTVTILLLLLHRMGFLEQTGTIQRTYYLKYWLRKPMEKLAVWCLNLWHNKAYPKFKKKKVQEENCRRKGKQSMLIPNSKYSSSFQI